MGVTIDVEGGEGERSEWLVIWLSYIKPMGQCLKVCIVAVRLNCFIIVFTLKALTISVKFPLRSQTTNLLL